MKELKSVMTPVNNESVVQQVINKITDAILTGELKPGDRLPPELEMMEMFRVSRNSLRSALQTLRAYGLIEVRRPEGTFVCDSASPTWFNPILYSMILKKSDSYEDVIGLRDVLDLGISKMIMSRGLTEEETQLLEDAYENIVKQLYTEPYDADAVIEADFQFHETIAKLTYNELVITLNKFMHDLTSSSRHRTVQTIYEVDDREYLDKVHRMHLDALEGKEGADIEEALVFSKYYWKDSFDSSK